LVSAPRCTLIPNGPGFEQSGQSPPWPDIAVLLKINFFNHPPLLPAASSAKYATIDCWIATADDFVCTGLP
jgi:hypothetical protein